MRPHRNATPILLALVSILFGLLVLVKLRDQIYGRPDRAQERRLKRMLRLRGDRALREALEAFTLQVNDPGGEFFSEVRDDQSLECAIPVTGVLRDLPSGVNLNQGHVQVSLVSPEPFLQGDRPLRGELRLEATFLRGTERLVRRILGVPFRLVRLGPPPPLGGHGLVLGEGEWLIPGNPERDQRQAQADLLRLKQVRKDLSGKIVEISRGLAEFVQAHGHLGGKELQEEALRAALEAILVEADPSRASIPEPVSIPRPCSVVARWWGVDLESWDLYRRWSESLSSQREEQAAAFGQSWERFSRQVEELFQPHRWSALPDGESLDRMMVRSAQSLEQALAELVQAAVRWEDFSRQTLGHHHQLATSFDLVAGSEREPLLQASQFCSPEAWRGQALAVFEGEGAADRCSRFLEGATGPFARTLSGVVFLDNAGGSALELRDKTIPGHLVVVATGDVLLANFGPRDSRTHHLTVQSEGKLRLQGKIRAYLIARGGIEMAPETLVMGGLFLPSIQPEDILHGRVMRDPVAILEDKHEELQVILGDLSSSGESP